MTTTFLAHIGLRLVHPNQETSYDSTHTHHATLLDLERELGTLDKTIKAAERRRELVEDATLHRRNAIAARIFKIRAGSLEALAVQAKVFLRERANERAGLNEDEAELEFSRLGRVLAEGIARLAAT